MVTNIHPRLLSWWMNLPSNDQIDEWKERATKSSEKLEYLEYNLLELEGKVRKKDANCQDAEGNEGELLAKAVLLVNLRKLEDLINENIQPEEGYRTTVCTSTRATPYMLVYGTEVVIPAEVEVPSLRIIQEAELDDAEWVKNRYEQLALIDGKRMNAVCHGQLYQNRMSRAFNKRVKPRQFTPGQLVLKKVFPHQDEAKGKLSPN
ncbi:uncharacterized protein [Nicotiana sylvestris]|uniref:uncharacterized protein n=1 Tax=Nicotiana sylvestris TaxID=4096 RepID=UPI00388CAFE1